jgi:hypothetical protein
MADHSDSCVGRSELIKETELKGGTVDNALRALKTKNIIVQNEMKSGLYKLPTKSLAFGSRPERGGCHRSVGFSIWWAGLGNKDCY